MVKSSIITTTVRARDQLVFVYHPTRPDGSIERLPPSLSSPGPHTLDSFRLQAFAMSIAAVHAQNGNPARGWKLNAFTQVNSCAPVPVVVQPSSDNSYTVSMYGEPSVANSLNAFVKDGQVYVENTAPFNTAKGVGVVLTMPADKLSSVTNKGVGGAASLTAVSGFTSPVMTINTVAGSGPTVLGINNANSSIYISHASSTNLSVLGEVSTIDFSTTGSSSGNASFNAVADAANINVASKLQAVYVGGAQNVLVTGSSVGATTFSNGTCTLSSGSCTEVPPRAVEQVTVPTFKGAAVAQICSCSGGCRNPPPPPPPPPQPKPSPPTPSPLGRDCASTGPNCVQCCQNKRNNSPLAYFNDASCQFGGACWSRPTPPTPPTPTPQPVGNSCSSTGPNCQECCQAKYYNDRSAYNKDKSCQPGGVCEWQPYSTGFIGRKLKAQI